MTSELPVTDEEWRQRAFNKHCLIALKVADSVKNGEETSRDIHMICQGIEIAQQTYTDAAISALEQPTRETREMIKVMDGCINIADSIIAEHCGITDTPKIWPKALQKVTDAKAALAAAAAHLQEPT